MKSRILLFLSILFAHTTFAQAQQCVTLRGKSGTGNFRQWLISSYSPYESDTTGPEIVAAAWTCNANGVPNCNFRNLIWYNVSLVPANATIVSARLYLTAHQSAINCIPGQPTYGSANTALLQRVTAAWGTNAGWNNTPATTTVSQKILPQSTSTLQNYEVDVKDFVQEWVANPASNQGMLLKLQHEVAYNSMVFYSGQAPEAVQPRLEICYTLPPPPAVCNNSVIIRGDRLSGKFRQLHLSTMDDHYGDYSQPEITAAAWTCNANGFPTCNFRSILQYDVSQVPAGATVTSATLYLYAHKNALNGYVGQPTYGSANTALLQKVTTSWSLTNTGWANQPQVTAAGQRILAQSALAAQNYTVDVKDLVQYWVNKPDSNFGAVLRLQNEVAYNSMIFYSGQAPDSLRPRLEICYTMNDPGRCAISFRDSVGTNTFQHQFVAAPAAGNNRRPVKLCWSFGDGQDTCINYDPSSSFNYYGITHTYATAGTYAVQLAALFEGSCSDTARMLVTVVAPPSPPGCDQQLVVKGNRTNGKFRQLLLSSYAPFAADTTQPEIAVAAWTCNAIGYPSCNFRGLMRYDLSTLPANAIITGARLYLYAKQNNINGYYGVPTFGNDNTALLQRVVTAWQPAGTGWNNQPATTTAAQKVLTQSTSPAQNYVVDVKDFVQYWVSKPDSNYGFVLRLQNEQYYNSLVFNSGQAADSLQPRLEICYTVPASGTDSCRAGFVDTVEGANSLVRTLRATTYNSGNKRPIRICWSFGDGKDTCINYNTTGRQYYQLNHRYATAGAYTVCVTIQYEGGCSASYCRKINVLGVPAPEPCTVTMVLKGDRTSGRYRQLHISTMSANQGDTSQPEITAAAWTCYASGYPTCTFRSLVRYDVSMVPANAIINSAKLKLYAHTNARNGIIGSPTYGDNNTALLQRIIAPWTLNGTGWINQPAATADKQKVLAQSTGTRQNYELDVTDFVQGWVKSPASNFGMLLKLQTEQYYNSLIFHSGQSADSVRPQLEICYTLPAADTNLVNMRLYPNPSTGPLQAWIQTNKEETGDAKLYDMQGNIKQVISREIRLKAGVNLVPVNIFRGTVPPGHYNVRIRVGTTSKTFKIFLL